ncbi:MAG: MFS transporter [Acidimicrobiales bacterium]
MAHRPTDSRLGRKYWYLWGTFAAASSGDGFAYGAVPLLAVVVAEQAHLSLRLAGLVVSSVVAADKLPWLLAALPAGVLSDRFERGRLMAIVNIARGVLLASMALLVGLGKMDLALLVLFVLANGTARTLYYSASQAAIPELVPPGTLATANGVLNGTEAAAEHLAGPIIGAFAFAAKQALPFIADASAIGASGLALLGLRTPRPDPAVARGSTWDGVRLLFGDRRQRVLLTLIAALSGLQGLVAGVLVLLARHLWGVEPRFYGVFLAAGAVGNVPGALLADRIVTRIGSAATLLSAALVSGLSYLVMAMTHSPILAGSAFALVGFAVAAGSVVAISLRQRLTPNEVMGRVGSAWRGIVWGAAPVGALCAGGLAVLGGLRLPLVLAGAAQCVVALVLARPLFKRLGRSAMPVPFSSFTTKTAHSTAETAARYRRPDLPPPAAAPPAPAG